jgi:hypothetical protein
MSFKPTTAQLELLAELELARMPVALIANRLGVDCATFKAWTARLKAGRDKVEPPESAADIFRKLCPGRAQREQEPRVVADRIFEGS